MNPRHSRNKWAFTLVEMLVVLAVLSVLIALLLTGISKARERSNMVTCLNHLRQIHVSLKLYVADNDQNLPNGLRLNSRGFADKRYLIGGKDGSNYGRSRSHYQLIPSASERPLFPYLKVFETFRCPADKGLNFPIYPMVPTTFEAVGCSYFYNMDRWPGGWPRVEPLPRHRESSILDPSRFVLMLEPPAQPLGGYVTEDVGQKFFTHWHEASGRPLISNKKLGGDSQRFISPILFADGHAKRYDFTKVIKFWAPLRGNIRLDLAPTFGMRKAVKKFAGAPKLFSEATKASELVVRCCVSNPSCWLVPLTVLK